MESRKRSHDPSGLLFLAVGIITPAYSPTLPEWLFYRAVYQSLTAGRVTHSVLASRLPELTPRCHLPSPHLLSRSRPVRLAAPRYRCPHPVASVLSRCGTGGYETIKRRNAQGLQVTPQFMDILRGDNNSR